MKKVIFTDFDGTITKTDTCSAMVTAFAQDGWEEINKLWETRKLTTEDCATMIFQLFNASLDDLKELLNSIEVDVYFLDFLSLCRQKGYRLYILSDGYDFNIETIQRKYGIHQQYYANKLIYTVDKGFSIQSPHRNPLCKRCGTCKTNLIQKLRGEDEVIYIGDSYSDICPAMNADVVFAKDVLYEFCQENGIDSILYTDFSNIIASDKL